MLLLLGTVYCALTVPVADDPSTAFNESDTPANLAIPASPGVKLVRSAADPVPVPQSLPEVAGGIRYSRFVPAAVPKPHNGAHSLLTLLCTFLI